MFKLTNEEINKIVLHSPYSLPDSPYKNGLGAEQIKRYFYEFIVYLADKLNLHLDQIKVAFDGVDESIKEINDRLDQVRDAESGLGAYIAAQINNHNASSEAHKEIRSAAESAATVAQGAHSLASGKSSVYVLHKPYDLLRLMKTQPEMFKKGDVVFFAKRGVSDFAVVCTDGSVSADTVLDFTEVENEFTSSGDVNIGVGVGATLSVGGSGVTVMAIEGGVDTSSLVTKEELGDLTHALDMIEDIQSSLIGGEE